jgi:hypothetical protein
MGSKKTEEQWGPDVSKEFHHMKHRNPKMEAIFGGIQEKVTLPQLLIHDKGSLRSNRRLYKEQRKNYSVPPRG